MEGGNLLETSKNIQLILNAAISSLTNVIPLKLEVLAPSITVQPYEQKELGVLIGLVGGIKGRLLIESPINAIDTIGQAMFGMTIEGEMIESFTGELGNMIAGNLCTVLEKQGLVLDISPPTVMTGETKFYGFTKAFKLPVKLETGASLNILLTIDDDNA